MATQTTQLTPNSSCTASGLGDPNNTTTVEFLSLPNATQWCSLTVSRNSPTAMLAQSVGDGKVTFEEGLTVTLTAISGSSYNVVLTGKIQDDGTMYDFNGLIVYVSS